MGIRFIDSLLALLAATAGVFVAYFIGFALSEHAAWAWGVAAGLFVAAAALGFLTVRRIRGYADERGEQPHS